MKKIFIIIGVIILIAAGFVYAYINAFASPRIIYKPDERPFFITTKPIIIKNISLPEGTKIIYKKQYFWEKFEQKKLPDEKDIISVDFKKGTTINWGGVPITSIVQFFNIEMKVYFV